ncbi:type II toxin-antitoxin system RelE/ParE family toxin [Rhizobium sp. WYJ-E13]|nr:type II toxin-antitoxin system RelE/ParE family toxin [Rhizobium sp. WYJ-E13]
MFKYIFLGRPEVDTLSGSAYANMKEIRVRFARQVWRFAFAFDPTQSAIILCGGDKQGMNEALFYKQLINKADARFAAWLKGKKND